MICPDPTRPVDGVPGSLALLDLDIPQECIPGVRDALDALASHWRIVAAFAVPDDRPR